MKKKCNRCRILRELSEFHKRSDGRSRDGLLGICKWCVRKQRRGKQCYRKRKYRYLKDALKHRVRQVVRDAVRLGKLTKPRFCDDCGKEFERHLLSGHHYRGYEHKLDVEWLCHYCHSLRRIKPVQIRPATIQHIHCE